MNIYLRQTRKAVYSSMCLFNSNKYEVQKQNMHFVHLLGQCEYEQYKVWTVCVSQAYLV